jgi:corrinoid protein of di/trimethylamine methyltransferase
MTADREAALRGLEQAVEAGDEQAASQLTQSLLGLGAAPADITASLSRAMARLGEQFQRLDIFVPDLLVAADAFGAAMAVATPAMLAAEAHRKPKGAIVLGVVEGDIHSLGKDLVKVMLAADGFEVHDLGRDVKVASFLEAAREHGADIIGMSALMTTTMDRMKDVVDLLEREGARRDHSVIVGGAPITRHFADQIGADGYAEDAPRAVALANRLIGAGASGPRAR